MRSILGYFRRGGGGSCAYSPQLVSDCLGGGMPSFADGCCCLCGGELSGRVSQPKKGHRHHGGRVCLFSGDLVNRSELIEAHGGQRQGTDGELCLHLFNVLGEGFARELSGQFVVVIYDGKDSMLRIYRDHVGQHPLFYSMLSGGQLIFGDDLRCLTHLPGCSTAMDLQGLRDYLDLGYVPAPETIYQGVRKLRPGCMLSVRSGGRVLVERRYWEPSFGPKLGVGMSDAVSEVWETLDRCVGRCRERHPGCDVLLSGGLDSNLVLALSSTDEHGPVRSFTAGFGVSSFDERGLASTSASALGVENQSCEVCASDCGMLDALERLSGEPFGDSSLIPTVKAMSLCGAGGHVLTGSGGDEAFGGYRRYQAMCLRSGMRWIPEGVLRVLSRLCLGMLPSGGESRSRLETCRRFLSFLGADSLGGYGSFQAVLSDALRHELLSDRRLLEARSYLSDWGRHLRLCGRWESWVEQFNELDLWWYLPDDGCRKEWLASCHTGVGKSSPLLDREVIDLGLRLPSRLRVTCGGRKRVLGALGERLLCGAVSHQRGKRGFGVPVGAWFRGELRPCLRDLCEGVRDWDVDGWFDESGLCRLADEHLSGRQDHGARLWVLWCLRSWLLSR